jgi:hypothetical protein
VGAKVGIIASSAATIAKLDSKPGHATKRAAKASIIAPSIKPPQVVGTAGFLLESMAESSTVRPREIHFRAPVKDKPKP